MHRKYLTTKSIKLDEHLEVTEGEVDTEVRGLNTRRRDNLELRSDTEEDAGASKTMLEGSRDSDIGVTRGNVSLGAEGGVDIEAIVITERQRAGVVLQVSSERGTDDVISTKALEERGNDVVAVLLSEDRGSEVGLLVLSTEVEGLKLGTRREVKLSLTTDGETIKAERG